MSQWGAYGQALKGRTHAQILATYYRGTTLEQAAPRTVRVLVVPKAKALRIASKESFRIKDAGGVVHQLPAGDVTLGPELKLAVDGVTTAMTGPVTVSPAGSSPLVVQGTGYRGRLTVTSDGKTAAGDQRSRAGAVPAGRRSGGDASRLATRGARGAGRRSPHVCARERRQGEAVRPLLRLAQPGLLRGRGGGSGDDARSTRDAWADPHLRRRCPRRRCTSRRRAAGHAARSTHTASTCRIWSPSTTRGTTCPAIRTIAGRPSR